MTRHPDPIVRRILVGDRARKRVRRRVGAVMAALYVKRAVSIEELRRLDDLVGEADALRRAL